MIQPQKTTAAMIAAAQRLVCLPKCVNPDVPLMLCGAGLTGVYERSIFDVFFCDKPNRLLDLSDVIRAVPAHYQLTLAKLHWQHWRWRLLHFLTSRMPQLSMPVITATSQGSLYRLQLEY